MSHTLQCGVFLSFLYQSDFLSFENLLKGYLIWALMNELWKWYASSSQKFHLSIGYPISCQLNGSIPCRERQPSPQHWGVGGLWPSPLIIEKNFSSWGEILVCILFFYLELACLESRPVKLSPSSPRVLMGSSSENCTKDLQKLLSASDHFWYCVGLSLDFS